MSELFQTGLRLASATATVSAVVLWLAFWATMPLREAAQYAVIGGVVVFSATYWHARRLLRRRFRRITDAWQQIAERRFDTPDEPFAPRDEVDELLLETRRTSQTIRTELLRLNRLETYRKDFIGDISHELKTPIFAIQGFIETLLNGALDDPRVNRRFLERADRNVSRLIELTEDLLEIARIESGEVKPPKEPVFLKEAVLEVVDSLQMKALDAQVTIRVAGFDPGIRVLADPVTLRQVLVNLVENGIKYNQPGGMVDVGAKTYPKNPAKLLISVRDTGMGIDPQDVNRVTERFFRTEKSRAREQGGSGLGLAIVKHIIEAHGERLMIESEVGKGSVFSFTLPNADRAQA